MSGAAPVPSHGEEPELDIEVGASSPRCVVCGEVIGIYEPVVRLEHGVATHTSRAASPDACSAPGARCYHRACWSESPASAAG